MYAHVSKLAAMAGYVASLVVTYGIGGPVTLVARTLGAVRKRWEKSAWPLRATGRLLAAIGAGLDALLGIETLKNTSLERSKKAKYVIRTPMPFLSSSLYASLYQL